MECREGLLSGPHNSTALLDFSAALPGVTWWMVCSSTWLLRPGFLTQTCDHLHLLAHLPIQQHTLSCSISFHPGSAAPHNPQLGPLTKAPPLLPTLSPGFHCTCHRGCAHLILYGHPGKQLSSCSQFLP